jgi:hypothetical protein
MKLSELRARPADVILALLIVTIQIGTFLELLRTTPSADLDPFDSKLYPLTWILYPALAAAASLIRSGPWRTEAWTIALVLPFMIEIMLVGTARPSADVGANLWLLGEILILIQGGFTYTVARIALRIREVHFSAN